jgi:hypothetical protein
MPREQREHSLGSGVIVTEDAKETLCEQWTSRSRRLYRAKKSASCN